MATKPLQAGGRETIKYTSTRHQQTLLQLAAAVCLTATFSLILDWGTRVLLLLLPAAAPQYLSSSIVAPTRPGGTRAGTPRSRAYTGLQVCYLSTSRARVKLSTAGLQRPRSIPITSALLCLQSPPPERPSSCPICPCPRPPAPSAASAMALA